MSLVMQLTLLPPWLAASLLIITIAPVAIISFLVVNRFIPVKIRKNHNDVAGFLYATAGIAYGVLLAFLVVVVWEHFNNVEANVEIESNVALILSMNISAYPDDQKSGRMKEMLLEYARLALQEHKEAVERIEAVDNGRLGIALSEKELLKIVKEVIMGDDRHSILDSEILKNVDELIKYKNLRLQAMDSDLPDSIWLAIILGGIIMIGFTFLFGTENVKTHIVMIFMVTVSIVVIIYVVIEVEYPFIGYTIVDPPQGYKIILAKAHS